MGLPSEILLLFLSTLFYTVRCQDCFSAKLADTDVLETVQIYSNEYALEDNHVSYEISPSAPSTSFDQVSGSVRILTNNQSACPLTCTVTLNRYTDSFQGNETTVLFFDTDHAFYLPSHYVKDNTTTLVCAAQNGYCGATVPVYRYYKISNGGVFHAYSFEKDLVFDGYNQEFFPICYVWPLGSSTVASRPTCGTLNFDTPLSALSDLKIFDNNAAGIERDHYFTTLPATDASLIGYNQTGVLGKVLTSSRSTACSCLVKLQQQFDNQTGYFHRLDHKLIATGNEMNRPYEAYVDTGEVVYCAKRAGDCGATLPLWKQFQFYDVDTVYTTTSDPLPMAYLYPQTPICYIWPSSYAPNASNIPAAPPSVAPPVTLPPITMSTGSTSPSIGTTGTGTPATLGTGSTSGTAGTLSGSSQSLTSPTTPGTMGTTRLLDVPVGTPVPIVLQSTATPMTPSGSTLSPLNASTVSSGSTISPPSASNASTVSVWGSPSPTSAGPLAAPTVSMWGTSVATGSTQSTVSVWGTVSPTAPGSNGGVTVSGTPFTGPTLSTTPRPAGVSVWGTSVASGATPSTVSVWGTPTLSTPGSPGAPTVSVWGSSAATGATPPTVSVWGSASPSTAGTGPSAVSSPTATTAGPLAQPTISMWGTAASSGATPATLSVWGTASPTTPGSIGGVSMTSVPAGPSTPTTSGPGGVPTVSVWGTPVATTPASPGAATVSVWGTTPLTGSTPSTVSVWGTGSPTTSHPSGASLASGATTPSTVGVSGTPTTPVRLSDSGVITPALIVPINPVPTTKEPLGTEQLVTESPETSESAFEDPTDPETFTLSDFWYLTTTTTRQTPTASTAPVGAPTSSSPPLAPAATSSVAPAAIMITGPLFGSLNQPPATMASSSATPSSPSAAPLASASTLLSSATSSSVPIALSMPTVAPSSGSTPTTPSGPVATTPLSGSSVPQHLAAAPTYSIVGGPLNQFTNPPIIEALIISSFSSSNSSTSSPMSLATIQKDVPSSLSTSTNGPSSTTTEAPGILWKAGDWISNTWHSVFGGNDQNATSSSMASSSAENVSTTTSRPMGGLVGSVINSTGNFFNDTKTFIGNTVNSSSPIGSFLNTTGNFIDQNLNSNQTGNFLNETKNWFEGKMNSTGDFLTNAWNSLGSGNETTSFLNNTKTWVGGAMNSTGGFIMTAWNETKETSGGFLNTSKTWIGEQLNGTAVGSFLNGTGNVIGGLIGGAKDLMLGNAGDKINDLVSAANETVSNTTGYVAAPLSNAVGSVASAVLPPVNASTTQDPSNVKIEFNGGMVNGPLTG